MDKEYYIGCDVGTGSVRAGIFNKEGRMHAMHTQDIKLWKPQPDFVEQSSEDIWQACCKSIRQAIKKSDLKPDQIQGIGFDATCSLVVLGEDDNPLSVNPHDKAEHNVIVWMDHRATKQAQSINQTQHEVLKYVGGRVSPEMQTPKLLWLKQHKPQIWNQATLFLDLADFLVYRATGKDIRSLCTTTCKWTYQGHKNASSRAVAGWDDSFFEMVGLGDLVEEDYQRIGQKVSPVGEPVGEGLTPVAAQQMGLTSQTPVGVAMIDAHAGGIGLLGMRLENGEQDFSALEKGLALIGGTSSCHMAVSKDPKFIDGVWGPYFSAMIPDMWLTEGGQSATGALIDHIIFSSSQALPLKEKAEEQDKTVYQLLNERLIQLTEQKGLDDVGALTHDLHVLPYFHGNRSPHADPSLTGGIHGLTLSSTLDELALLYLAVIQAIAYGTRHIIETLNAKGYDIQTIMATGGGTKNDIFLQQHADICKCTVLLPKEPEAVLLGSAVLGAVAGGAYANIYEAMATMNQPGKTITPQGGAVTDYHERKYSVFHKMYTDQQSYKKLMK